MPSVARTGDAIGTTIDQKTRNSFAPSMRAASSSSFGTPNMNWRMRKTPNGPARNGRISPG